MSNILTPREKEIFNLLIDNNNTKEIEETPSEENPCDTCVYNKKE